MRPLVLMDYALATTRMHPWLKQQLQALQQEHKADEIDVWGGQHLAKIWADMSDPKDKAAVRQEIQAYWQEQGWWDKPPGKAKRKARNIYGD